MSFRSDEIRCPHAFCKLFSKIVGGFYSLTELFQTPKINLFNQLVRAQLFSAFRFATAHIEACNMLN